MEETIVHNMFNQCQLSFKKICRADFFFFKVFTKNRIFYIFVKTKKKKTCKMVNYSYRRNFVAPKIQSYGVNFDKIRLSYFFLKII